MPISLSCTSCGRGLRVKDELAGREILCPDCQTKLTVPGRDFPPPLPEPDAPMATAYTREKPSENPYDARAEVEPARRPQLDDDYDDEPPPRRPEKKPAKEPFSINAGIGGGLLMMLIAVVWFVLGLIFDTMFCYPPILFVIGLVAFIRGLIVRD